MKRVTLAVSLFLLAGMVSAQQAVSPTKKALTLEALQAEIESLRPAKLAWREIPWRSCLLEGLREARAKQRPVVLWAFGNGNPSEERC